MPQMGGLLRKHLRRLWFPPVVELQAPSKQKVWKKRNREPMYLLHHTCTASPTRMVHSLICWPYNNTRDHPKSIVDITFTLGGGHYMGSEKCVMTCIQQEISERVSSALDICALPSHPSPLPHHWQSLTFRGLHSFAFGKCNTVGIIHCVAFLIDFSQ